MEATERPYDFYETSRTHWLAITHILFEVILLLHKDDQISVADAIWHSVMNAHWRKGNCLESVSDFPEQLTIEKRKGMFRLDKFPNGSFEHKWLVDRIMLQGGFWVGRLVRLSTDHEFSYSDTVLTGNTENHTTSVDDRVGCTAQDQRLEEKFDSPVQQHAELNIEIPRAASASQAYDVAIIPRHQSPSISADGSSVLAAPHSPIEQARSPDSFRQLDRPYEQRFSRTHSNYQLMLSMLMQISNQVSITSDDIEEEVDHPTDSHFAFKTPPAAALIDFAALMYNMDSKNSQRTLQQQRAVFDIKGDTSGQVLVLTPFQKRLETLPRPITRSMSVSWVVQPVPLSGRSEDMEGPGRPEEEEILKTSGMVRGMWKYMVHPENRYKLV